MTLSTSTLRLLRRLVAAPAVLLLLLTAVVAATPAQARDLRASVKGIVIDSLTGKGVGGTTVYVMEEVYPGGVNPSAIPDWGVLARTTTSKTGAYTVALPRAGTFKVFFVPADRDRYAMEAYPDAAVPYLGDDVVVRYGRATTGISVRLDAPKRIEGHVWAAESHWADTGEDDGAYEPLAGITVHVAYQGSAVINLFVGFPESDPPGEPLGSDVTDETGSYTVSGFKEFPFFIWANPFFMDGADPTRRDRIVYDGSGVFQDGAMVVDTFLATTDEVNVTGRLVDEAHQPVAGAQVLVWETDQTEQEQSWQPKCAVTTDASGTFGDPSTASPEDRTCLNLLEPSALLQFEGDGVLAGEFFDDAGEEWGARQVRVSWGWTEDIGDWVLGPAGPGGE